MKSTLFKINPRNPRLIGDEQFARLAKSIEDFPEMMKLRPIVVIPEDDQYLIIGGTMRYRALQSLGYEIIPDEWIKVATDLTEEQIEEFIIKDNLQAGDWDFAVLDEFFDVDKLGEWGLEIPEMEVEGDEDDTESKEPKDLSEQISDGFTLEIKMETENDCQLLFERLTSEGYTCRILTF